MVKFGGSLPTPQIVPRLRFLLMQFRLATDCFLNNLSLRWTIIIRFATGGSALSWEFWNLKDKLAAGSQLNGPPERAKEPAKVEKSTKNRLTSVANVPFSHPTSFPSHLGKPRAYLFGDHGDR